MNIITSTIDSILERKAKFVAKAGKRVLPMPTCNLHVAPGQMIVDGKGETYKVESVDWTNIQMTLDRRLVFDVKMSDFRHLNPRSNERYGFTP